MNPAGKRDKRVTIQRFTITGTDEYNDPIEEWSDIATRWTAMFYGKGEERRQAAVEQGKQAASFVMLADSMTKTVTLRDRLAYAGDTWEIVGIMPIDRAEIEFTAVRSL